MRLSGLIRQAVKALAPETAALDGGTYLALAA